MILGGDIRIVVIMRFFVDVILIVLYGCWDNNFWMDVRNMMFFFFSVFMVYFIEFDNDLFGILGVEIFFLDF